MTSPQPPGEPAINWAMSRLADGVPPGSVTLDSATGLREGGNPWLLRGHHGEATLEAILKLEQVADSAGFTTEIAALRLVERHGIAAPRVLGVNDGDGCRAVLETVLPGRSTVPAAATRTRLLAMGRAAAQIQSVALEPTAELPARVRPIPASDFSADRRAGRDHGSPLLSEADALIAALPIPDGPTGLVHGDLWQGNMLWLDDTVSGLIDWDMAGVGHHGIDLSSMRLDAALMFGVEAADPVLTGWEDTTGTAAADLAYWDVVTALNQPGDMAGFAPAIQDQGRTDLTATILNERRDAFLRDGLKRLDG